ELKNVAHHGYQAASADWSEKRFVYLHVEPLLDQAADLLDRAASNRATYDQLASEMMTQILELKEALELEEIREQEEKDGAYSVGYKRAVADIELEHETESVYSQIVSGMNKLEKQLWDQPRREQLWHAALVNAYMQAGFSHGEGLPQFPIGSETK